MEPERSRRLERKKGRARREERNCDWQKSWWNDSRRKRTAAFGGGHGHVKKESSIREYTFPETRKALVVGSRVKEREWEGKRVDLGERKRWRREKRDRTGHRGDEKETECKRKEEGAEGNKNTGEKGVKEPVIE